MIINIKVKMCSYNKGKFIYLWLCNKVEFKKYLLRYLFVIIIVREIIEVYEKDMKYINIIFKEYMIILNI